MSNMALSSWIFVLADNAGLLTSLSYPLKEDLRVDSAPIATNQDWIKSR